MLTLKPSFALFIGVLSVLMLGLFGGSVVKGQRVYATTVSTGQTGGSNGSATFTNPTYAQAPNSSTPPALGPAVIAATGNGSLLGGIFSYSGWITLKFGTAIPANRTVFIKVAASNAAVLADAYSGSSTTPVVGAQSKIVTASDGSVYYAITSSASFDQVRLTATGTGSILGNGTTTVSLYYAFYESNDCANALFTNTSGGGLLGGTATNLSNAIDGNTATYSTISPALLLSSIEQVAYFSGPSTTNDEVKVTLSVPPAVLNLGVLSGISVNAYSGSSTSPVWTVGIGTLLNLDLLGLLGSGTPVTLSVTPTVPFDRVSISFGSVANVLTTLYIHEIQRTSPSPTFTVQNATICAATTTILKAVPPVSGNEIRWYNSAGTLLFTGNNFTTPALNSSTTYYVSNAKIGCTLIESLRVPAVVTIDSIASGTISGSQTFCSASIPTAFTTSTAATANGTLSYQWQKSIDNITFNNISGATSENYTETATVSQTTYYQRIAASTLNGVTCSSISNKIIVAINTITPGTIGSDQTLCSSTVPAAFTNTAATGAGTITYQWQKSTDNITFSNITGATNAAYSETTALTQTTYYQRVATSSLNSITCTATSNKITMTVNAVTAGTIGSDQTLCSGGVPTSFTNTAATGAGTITYQWQKSTDNITFSNITGATNATYSETATLTQTTYYQRIATSTLNAMTCNATSNKITITINAVTAGTIGSNQTLCSSTVPAAFTNTAATGGGTITYQWQKSTDNITFSNIIGATNAAYSETAALTQTTYYQRIATSTLNAIACTATSNKITMTVNAVTAGTIGSDQTLCSNTVPAAFTNTAATGAGTITYQWQKSTDNITFSNITGATNVSYSETAALTQTTYYQRIATSSLNSVTCTATSNKITMTVNLPPTVSSIVGPSSLCPGTAYTFTNASTDPGTWSSDDPTVASVNPSTGFVTGIAVGSTLIKYKITNATTGCSNTASKSVTVYALPSITLGAIPAICLGTTTTSLPYTAVSSGSMKYDINWDTPGFVNVSNADLPTSPITLNIPANASAGNHTGTLIIKNTTTGCTFSQLITVSINPLPTITITSDASVCKGITTVELLYTATSAPTSYNITWKTAASADGFINVPDTALPASPINIIVPSTATVKTYIGTIIVKNANGCISSPVDFNVVVHPKPNPPQINIQ